MVNPGDRTPREKLNHDASEELERKSADQEEISSFRQKLGAQICTLSDSVNSNLIIVRYATVSSIVILGMYGLANTPLLHRYTNVVDMPRSMFFKRKRIHGRIVGVLEKNTIYKQKIGVQSWKNPSPMTASPLPSPTSLLGDTGSDRVKRTTCNLPDEQPVVILFRHSSLIERLLTKSALDKVLSLTMEKHPKILFYSPGSNPYRNLLTIELAGVSYFPSLDTSTSKLKSYKSLALLHQLVHQKARVSLQLLAQRISSPSIDMLPSYYHQGIESQDDKRVAVDGEMHGTAICHMFYRQSDQWFQKTNVSLELVKLGQAILPSSGMIVSFPNNLEESSSVQRNDKTFKLLQQAPSKNEMTDSSIIVNYNPTVKQLQENTKFISDLEQAEYQAWKSRAGVWSYDHIKEIRKEYAVEEEVKNSQWSTKIRRFLIKMWKSS